MNTKTWLVLSYLIITGTFASAAIAPGTKGVVQADRVNVRGQPSLIGEVIHQLRHNDQVVILDEIEVKKPKEGEPTRWYKIQLPKTTTIWVNSNYVDPATHTVTASKLNLRAGPGENYSILGRVEKGTTLKPIRSIDNWIEIEPPDDAFAFVAADFITLEDQAAVTATTKTPIETEKTEPQKPSKPPNQETQPQPLIADQVTLQNEPELKPATTTQDEKPAVQPQLTEPPEKTEQPQQQQPTPPTQPQQISQPPAQPTPQPQLENPRRIVIREGIVRSTVSIQAPSYYELVSKETRKTINFLYSTSTNLPIKPHRGKFVRVSGEEVIDPRWPNTPVLMLESIQVITNASE